MKLFDYTQMPSTMPSPSLPLPSRMMGRPCLELAYLTGLLSSFRLLFGLQFLGLGVQESTNDGNDRSDSIEWGHRVLEERNA
mmetsp:Transcript_11175/g.68913  ORF Transcript_11175/g.68913 Transcript_11175/m.68913 type:complete len:82 (-) Transcript_11175:1229-1474(-)